MKLCTALMLSGESGWSASGSDAALELIEAELNAKPDNYGKLRGADEKHLFTWVDGDTDLAVARPFRGEHGRVGALRATEVVARTFLNRLTNSGSSTALRAPDGLGHQLRVGHPSTWLPNEST